MSTSLQLNDKYHDNKTTDTINDINENGSPQVSTVSLGVNEQPLCRNTDDFNVKYVLGSFFK